jgi:hypothetical protein
VEQAAVKILVVGGVLNLALSFAVGFVWSRKRLADPNARVSSYLELTHRMSLWEAFMLLGLVFAVLLSELPSSLEVAAASLLVASSVFQDGSAILNWVQGVDDQFARRSTGLTLASINAVLATAGLAILLVGVFRAL